MQTFSSCSEQGQLLAAVRGLLLAGASPAADPGLQAHGLSSCGAQAELFPGMWDLESPLDCKEVKRQS